MLISEPSKRRVRVVLVTISIGALALAGCDAWDGASKRYKVQGKLTSACIKSAISKSADVETVKELMPGKGTEARFSFRAGRVKMWVGSEWKMGVLTGNVDLSKWPDGSRVLDVHSDRHIDPFSKMKSKERTLRTSMVGRVVDSIRTECGTALAPVRIE